MAEISVNNNVGYAIHDRIGDVEQNLKETECNINKKIDEVDDEITHVEHELNETINASWNDMFHRLDKLRVLCYHRFVLNIALSIINFGLIIYILLR